MLHGTRRRRKIQPKPLVTKDEITAAYLKYLITQDQSYFYAMPGAMPGDSAMAFVEDDSLFDAEHVNGILRYLVGKRPHFADNVAIFPVYNPDAFYRLAQDLVVSKMLQLPKYKHLVKDKTPLIEISECLGDEDLLEQRNAEEAFRNEQDNQANEIAGTLLAEIGMTTDVMLQWYLDSIAKNPTSLVGNKTNPLLHFADCSQFVIPFRKDENHYTVAVVNCVSDEEDSGIANIQYYDSLGDDLPESEAEQLCDFFRDQNFDEVNYDCVSVKEQREGHNCGIFAAFKAIDLLNDNTEQEERLIPNLEIILESEYCALFNYFRNRVVEMLRKSGCNIALSDELVQTLKSEQEARDKPAPLPQPSFLEGVIGGVTSFFWGGEKKRKVPEPVSTVDPLSLKRLNPGTKTSIANCQWDKPTATLITETPDEDTSESDDEDYAERSTKRQCKR